MLIRTPNGWREARAEKRQLAVGYLPEDESTVLQAPDLRMIYARAREQSLPDGPAAGRGFDLVLDELDDGFLVRSGSHAGEDILTRLATRAATEEQCTTAAEATSTRAERRPASARRSSPASRAASGIDPR